MLANGATVFSPGVAAKFVGKLRFLLQRHINSACRSVRLSPRQRKVLELLEKGLSNKEIASTLAISPNTVKNHVQVILKKLQVENS